MHACKFWNWTKTHELCSHCIRNLLLFMVWFILFISICRSTSSSLNFVCCHAGRWPLTCTIQVLIWNFTERKMFNLTFQKTKKMYNLVNSPSFGWKIFGRCVERGASSHSLFNPSKIGQPEAQSRRWIKMDQGRPSFCSCQLCLISILVLMRVYVLGTRARQGFGSPGVRRRIRPAHGHD